MNDCLKAYTGFLIVIGLIFLLAGEGKNFYTYSKRTDNQTEANTTAWLEVVTAVYNSPDCIGQTSSNSTKNSTCDSRVTTDMDRDGNGNKIISCLKPTDFSLQVIVFKDGLVKGLFEVPASDRGKTIEILGNTQYNIRVTGGSFLEEFKPEYSPQCRSEIVAGGLSTCHISMRHKDLI